MEKLIKIKARMIDGTTKKYRTTKLSVKPFRNSEKNRLYINIDNHHAFACKSIEIEQKKIEPTPIEQPLSSLKINDKGDLVRILPQS